MQKHLSLWLLDFIYSLASIDTYYVPGTLGICAKLVNKGKTPVFVELYTAVGTFIVWVS